MLLPAEKRLNSQDVLNHAWLKKYTAATERVELPSLITKQLKIFRSAQRVKKVVLTYLATQLSEKEMEPMKKLFMGLDKNGDGILSAEEIADGLKGRSDEKELIDIISSIDTDGSGFVDYNGFFIKNLRK